MTIVMARVRRVRFGSKAEIKTIHPDVCFTSESRHTTAKEQGLLRAKSGHPKGGVAVTG